MKFNGQVVEPYGYKQSLADASGPITGLYETEILVTGPMPTEMMSVVTEAEYQILEEAVCLARDFERIGENEYRYRLLSQFQLPLLG